jgi:sulfane dehydrogenase subunit SoxC
MDLAPAGTTADQGISQDELRLAARNHALPLEALRHDITPPGLHYLLIHYDIPAVDPNGFRLEIGGAVERPITLTLDDLKTRDRTAEPVTFECAGNGRALLEPRPQSQPW